MRCMVCGEDEDTVTEVVDNRYVELCDHDRFELLTEGRIGRADA